MSIYQQQWVARYIESMTPGALNNPALMNQMTVQIISSEAFRQFVTEFLKVFGLLLLQQVLLVFLLFFYLGAYLVDLETKNPRASQYFAKFYRALPRFTCFNALFYMVLFVLFILLVGFLSYAMMIMPMVVGLLPIAWFLVRVIFVFKDVALLDTRVGIFKNFSLASKLSSGNRIMIGVNTFFMESTAMMFFLLPLVTILQNNAHTTMSLFLVSFLEVILLMIRQRLIALMYFDRTRIVREEESAED